ncbi:uncharacterized protein BDR25DRAFT_370795 [Lindgomyces ingoldianus]|uniref:Uncharacterized protein n=1 Tax=Lindgomyces ingoldianus TaxID=673940 RepID=A0ACB6RF58_9PLEO|nr:uncharacterized protein BDR25DRAFT_370795 [Lindgomyces ingoldianus]KAF2476960.1 hypothetical protein BDR25DRAFT_370795 [Lindgomyces ingoldianus]
MESFGSPDCYNRHSLIRYNIVMHMTKEMLRLSEEASRVIMFTICAGGVMGTAFILVMLFSLTDLETMLNISTHMRITEIIFQATNNRGATVVLAVLLGMCFLDGTIGCITSVSRRLYAIARDKRIVFPSFFRCFRKGHDVPFAAIMLCFFFNLCFGLLYLGSSTYPPVSGWQLISCIGPSVAFPAYPSTSRTLSPSPYEAATSSPNQTLSTPFKLGRWGAL